jgi:hypothetical protein
LGAQHATIDNDEDVRRDVKGEQRAGDEVR